MLGEGIIKGLLETGKNFVGSYHDSERMVTVEYPENKIPAMENARNFPFLVFDGDDAMKGLRCDACQICEKECPPQCIYLINDTPRKPAYVGTPHLQAKIFHTAVS